MSGTNPITDQLSLARIQERYPPLFKSLPDRLFGPLASQNRFQYWSLLCALFAKRFGPEAELPPSHGFPGTSPATSPMSCSFRSGAPRMS